MVTPMTLTACAPPSPASQRDLEPFERLVADLSSTFSTLDSDDAEKAIAHALARTAALFGADECTLIAYGERGAATLVSSWAVSTVMVCQSDDVAELPWLLQRVARNTVVAITAATVLPLVANRDREYAMRTGLVARLAVPVAIGARVGHALMLGSQDRRRDWGAPLIDRLRLIGEILGAGIERLRQQHAVPNTASGAPVAPSAEERIVGESAALRLALTRLEQVAPLDAAVLLLGETGTGKEQFARVVHDHSTRARRAMVRVNCAALPASLIESELFGHERGAFTGAVTMRPGRFEVADGGTIFLDEVGDLAPEVQAKLLRVLQEREFERVGSSVVRRVDVRVVAATHVDLERAVADGRFRADLYYRLNVFPIVLPPLRERREDIPALVWHFIRSRQGALQRRIETVPDPVMRALQEREWPGNIRELANVIERALIRSTDGALQLDELGGAALSAPLPPAVPLSASTQTMDAVQRLHIERVLRECGGRINGAGNAAVRLGMHPNTLRFRIRKLGVQMPLRYRPGATAPSAAHSG
jgi:formate hydrogenlyase transcriptional activator